MELMAPMRPTFKLIPDFIIPHLEQRTYGRHLIWEDREKGSFKVSRIHQSSELWSDDCIGVYKAWSLEKKLWKLDDSKRITKAKHRLITALRRSPVIEVLQKESAYYRFQFTSPITEDKNSLNGNFYTKSDRPLLELEGNKDLNNDNSACPIIHEKSIMKEVYISVMSRKVNNDTVSSVPSQEIENKFKEIDTLNESCGINPSVYYSAEDYTWWSGNSNEDNIWWSGNSDEDNIWWSGKCCCDILLDSTLLCNERCIWHGKNS